MTETYESHDQVLEAAQRWMTEGQNVALATVINTWGSSPRPVGSQLAISDQGNFIGSVSGGCIEGSVIDQGMQTMTTGEPAMLEFGVTNEQAWEVGLACGGTVQVYVEKVSP